MSKEGENLSDKDLYGTRPGKGSALDVLLGTTGVFRSTDTAPFDNNIHTNDADAVTITEALGGPLVAESE